MGRIRKTTGIIKPISALPARLMITLLLAIRASRTCEVSIGPKADPLSIPKTKLVTNRRNVRELNLFARLSSASTIVSPPSTSATKSPSVLELNESDLCASIASALAGVMPALIKIVIN